MSSDERSIYAYRSACVCRGCIPKDRMSQGTEDISENPKVLARCPFLTGLAIATWQDGSDLPCVTCAFLEYPKSRQAPCPTLRAWKQGVQPVTKHFETRPRIGAWMRSLTIQICFDPLKTSLTSGPELHREWDVFQVRVDRPLARSSLATDCENPIGTLN